MTYLNWLDMNLVERWLASFWSTRITVGEGIEPQVEYLHSYFGRIVTHEKVLRSFPLDQLPE